MIEALRTARHNWRPLRLSRNEVCELLDLLESAEEEGGNLELLEEADRRSDSLDTDLAEAEGKIDELERERAASEDQEEEQPEEDPKPAEFRDGDDLAREPKRSAFREDDRHAIAVTLGPF